MPRYLLSIALATLVLVLLSMILFSERRQEEAMARQYQVQLDFTAWVKNSYYVDQQ